MSENSPLYKRETMLAVIAILVSKLGFKVNLTQKDFDEIMGFVLLEQSEYPLYSLMVEPRAGTAKSLETNQ